MIVPFLANRQSASAVSLVRRWPAAFAIANIFELHYYERHYSYIEGGCQTTKYILNYRGELLSNSNITLTKSRMLALRLWNRNKNIYYILLVGSKRLQHAL